MVDDLTCKAQRLLPVIQMSKGLSKVGSRLSYQGAKYSVKAFLLNPESLNRLGFGRGADRDSLPFGRTEHEQILDALRHRQGALLREVLRSHHLSGWRTTRAVLEGEIRL